jgi:hypothetical protein
LQAKLATPAPAVLGLVRHVNAAPAVPVPVLMASVTAVVFVSTVPVALSIETLTVIVAPDGTIAGGSVVKASLVAVGVVALTVTVLVAVFDHMSASVTFSVTVYVPAEVKVCEALSVVPLALPSPHVHV